MNAYKSTSRTAKLAIAIVTIALSLGVLEIVANDMKHPDPDTVAMRQHEIAAKADQVQQARALRDGDVKAAELRHGKRI